MKKIIYTLLMLVGFGSIGFAQEKAEIANSKGKVELTESKISGEYVFGLPENVTAEQVKKNSAYYTSNFTVEFNADSHESTLTLIENEVISRHVVARFLSSCGVQYIEVDGENITIDEFIALYLK